MNQLKLLLVGLFALCSILSMTNGNQNCKDLIVNGYYGSWAHWQGLKPEYIDASLLTHLTFPFVGLTSDNKLDPGKETNQIKACIDLKEKNPHLKVLAAFGGSNEELTPLISKMAGDGNERRTFIDSAFKFIQQYNFDGLDVDWEFPTSTADKKNFVTLLKELNEKLKTENLLLTVAVGLSETYDMPGIAKHVDLIHVMNYNYNSNGILANAPLPSVKNTIEEWLGKGVPAHKLILGLAFYGHGSGQKDLPYRKICEWAKNSRRRIWNAEQSVPFLSETPAGTISYDDEESIGLKVEYAIDKGLGGVMIWSIDHDDYSGTCSDQKFPLLNAVNSKICNKPRLNSNSPTKTSKPKNPNNQQHNSGGSFNIQNQKPVEKPNINWDVVPDIFKKEWSIFRKPSSEPQPMNYRPYERPVANRHISAPQGHAPGPVKCTDSENRFHPHETDPTKYYECNFNDPIPRDCPGGTMFYVETGMCDYIQYPSYI